MHSPYYRRKQALEGNALFLILIAVALFAALAYAVTQSGRGGGGTSRETATIKAAQIADYAALIRQGVTRLMVLNNCTADEINFDGYTAYAGHDPGWAGEPPTIVDNPARADGTCDVFTSTGADVSVMGFDASFCRAGQDCFFGFLRAPVVGIGNDPVDTTDPSGWEIFLWGSNIDVGVCRAINSALGIDSPLDATGYDSGTNYLETVHPPAHLGTGAGTEFAGKAEGCYCWGGADGECNPYFVVVTR